MLFHPSQDTYQKHKRCLWQHSPNLQIMLVHSFVSILTSIIGKGFSGAIWVDSTTQTAENRDPTPKKKLKTEHPHNIVKSVSCDWAAARRQTVRLSDLLEDPLVHQDDSV